MTIAAPEVRVDETAPRYLSGPVADFMMLGGMTLFIFPVLLVLPTDSFRGPFGLFVFWLAFAINHPHFAVSYRIFYEDFGRKVSPTGSSDTTLRYRYLVAGIVAPTLLLLGLVAVALSGSSELLGYGYNLMGFFVGWHYVKQAYGMAMVDSALKRRYLPAFDKKVLLVNGYAVWAFTYAIVNRGQSLEFWGLSVRLFDLPVAVSWVTGLILAGTTTTALVRFARRALHRQPTAWIGIMSYMVTLYLWMILVRAEPLFALFTPALHSLQYLWVVKRFQQNRHAANPTTVRSWRSQFSRSLLLGAGMFFIVPVILLSNFSLDESVWGTQSFFFIFIVFINIHHYFLDNVMWRRGNREVSEHLFA